LVRVLSAPDGRQRLEHDVGALAGGGLGPPLVDESAKCVPSLRASTTTPQIPDTRSVLLWLWDGTRTGGWLSPLRGDEIGFGLRFPRYKKVQVTA
jgi:hypothetical protein